MLTGGTSKEDQRTIMQRLARNPKMNGRFAAMDDDEKEIKLVYVTVSLPTPSLSPKRVYHQAVARENSKEQDIFIYLAEDGQQWNICSHRYRRSPLCFSTGA